MFAQISRAPRQIGAGEIDAGKIGKFEIAAGTVAGFRQLPQVGFVEGDRRR